MAAAVLVLASGVLAGTSAQEKQRSVSLPPGAPASHAGTQPGAQARSDEGTGGTSLKLRDGERIAVDDAWEDTQGVWYRQAGITRLVERDRVLQIERPANLRTISSASEKTTTRLVNVDAAKSTPVVRPVWIYLIGGARVEADEAAETASGVWYRRGTLSIFIDRARIERVEREREQTLDTGAVARTSSERGWSTGNSGLDGLIRQSGARYAVDPYLIFCVMEQESHFNAHAVSPKGARGLMQLMPGTGARFGVRRPFNPAENVMGGTRYLKQLLENFGGRVDLVLASYNAGEGAVIKYGGRVPPYRETRDYVKKISARYGPRRPDALGSTSAAADQKTARQH